MLGLCVQLLQEQGSEVWWVVDLICTAAEGGEVGRAPATVCMPKAMFLLSLPLLSSALSVLHLDNGGRLSAVT